MLLLKCNGQLARNAIDTVNGLKTEADAVDFLTYAYEGLKGAALDATEAMLRSAVAAAKMRGVQQGIAAEKIYQGYLATKQAIGNVDFGSDSLAGKSDSDKDKSDKDKSDKDKEQQDTKTKFNWLEKLVNKIQRSIDKIANSVDKYFTYWNKNTLVDRQIAANQKMIGTQQYAVDFYQNKANKALKKVPKKFRNLVSGDFDPTTTKKLIQEIGSKNTKKLEEYLDWQQLLEGAQDALEEAYDKERELIDSKLTNILDYFDALNGYQRAIIDRLDAQNRLREAKGETLSLNDMLIDYQARKQKLEDTKQQQVEYSKMKKEVLGDAEQGIVGELEKSYNEQLSALGTDYKTSSEYQKLIKKKAKWAKAAVDDLASNPVLAEDVGTYMSAYQTYYKNKDKKQGSKARKKADEAWESLEALRKKYQDAYDQIITEKEEQFTQKELEYRQQETENATAVDEADIELWEEITGALTKIVDSYDTQIQQLNTITQKFVSISDLLSSVDKELLDAYGVSDLLGLDANASETSLLVKAIFNINNELAQYRKEAEFLNKLIPVLESGNTEKIASAFKEALLAEGISDELKSTVEEMAEKFANDKNWQPDDTILADLKERLTNIDNGIVESVKNSQSYVKSIVDSIAQTSDKEIAKLNTIINKFSTVADLTSNVNPDILKKYGISNLFGSEISAYINAINYSKQAVLEQSNQIETLQKVISALQDYDSSALTNLANGLDAETKQVVLGLASVMASGTTPVDVNSAVQTFNEKIETLLSDISSEVTKSVEYSNKMIDSITKTSRETIEAINSLQSVFNAKMSLINDNWLVDVNGITKYGYAKANLLNDQISNSQRTADEYYVQMQDLEKNKDWIIEEAGLNEYNKRYNEAWRLYLEELGKVESYQQQIYEITQKGLQKEIDTITDLVNNYKKALQAKKSYYDYDKTLKDKNKNIQSLQSQIAALNGVADAASKARLKALESELKEAQEDLNDTVFNHTIEVESDALDKLLDELNEVLDDSAKTIEEIEKEFYDSVNTFSNTAKNYPTNEILERLEQMIRNGSTDTSTDNRGSTAESSSVNLAAEAAKANKKAEIINAENELNTVKNKQSAAKKAYEDAYNAVLQYEKDNKKGFPTISGHVIKASDVSKYKTLLKQYVEAEKAYQEYQNAAKEGMHISQSVMFNGQSYVVNGKFGQELKNFKKEITRIETAGQQALNTYNTTMTNLKKDRDTKLDTYKSYNTEITTLENTIKTLKEELETLTANTVAMVKSTKESTTVKSSGSSVADDLASGVYSSISSTTATGANDSVLKILQHSASIDNNTANIFSKLDYIPNIAKNIESMTANVSGIAKNTSTIAGQLAEMQTSVDSIGKMIPIIGTNGTNTTQLYKQLQKAGISRKYY